MAEGDFHFRSAKKPTNFFGIARFDVMLLLFLLLYLIYLALLYMLHSGLVKLLLVFRFLEDRKITQVQLAK